MVNLKKHPKLNLLYLIIFIITLYGCGSDMNTSSNDTGTLSFALKWETPNNISSPPVGEGKGEGEGEGVSYAPQIDCTAIGVSTVSANVYDSGGTYITSGGPWNCSDHSGTITGISAGINRMITVNGKDSSSRIIYNGQITGVTINKDQTTDAGQITMTYVANDTTAPTDGSLSASAGSSQVSLSWSGFSDSGSGLGSYKLVYSTTSTPSSCSSGTQIFTGTSTSYTHTGLTNGTTYYYRICATDKAGNTSSGATASAAPSSSGTTTTTGSAPSAPTGVTATAGNGQVSISWTAVTGATSYNIYWSTTSGVTKTTGTKITGATSSYIHTGLTNGTTYYYVVTAVNSYGESSESSHVSGTPTSITKHFQVDTGGTLTTNLVAYYKLEDTTDYWASYNLTNNNSVAFNPGKINNGIDGGSSNTTKYLSVGSNMGVDGGVISIAGWIKVNTTPNFNVNHYYASQSSNGNKVGYSFLYRNDGGVYKVRFFRDRTGILTDVLDVTQTLTIGTWYHLVLTYDGVNVEGWINGVSKGTAASTGNGNYAGAVNGFYILNYTLGGEIGSGMVDELGVWTKKLSNTEISDLYNSGNGNTMQ